MHKVKCYYCNQYFDADKEPYVKVNERRYAHEYCQEHRDEIMSQEEKDKEELDNYIMEKLNLEFVTPIIQKQIKAFLKDYKYTYKGIYLSLKYYFEVQNNPAAKTNGRISIVPYIYEEAQAYWERIEKNSKQNENKNIADYIPTKIKVKIKIPERPRQKRSKKFSFLDEERGD